MGLSAIRVANATVNRELAALKAPAAARRACRKGGQPPYIAMLEEKNTRKGFFEEEQFRFRDGSRCERGKFGATRGGRGIEAETQRLGSARQDGK